MAIASIVLPHPDSPTTARVSPVATVSDTPSTAWTERPDGSAMRILTEGFHNEGPTWAPNGRVLMFFRDTPGANGGPQLWTIDLTGYNENRVPSPSFASDPAWSPLIN